MRRHRSSERCSSGQHEGSRTRSIAAWIKTLPKVAHSGRVLNASSVRFALAAAVYVGRVSNRKEDQDYETILAQPVGRWPQLVSDDAWRTMHRRIASYEQMP